jgi:hypothetical protein
MQMCKSRDLQIGDTSSKKQSGLFYGLMSQWQCKVKGSAFLQFAFGPDAAAMLFNDIGT